LKIDVNVASKSNKQKNFLKSHLEGSLTKTAGSGAGVRSGSESGVSQRYGSADPDPYQNVADQQHRLQISWETRKNETRRIYVCYLQLGLHLVAEAQGIKLNLQPIVEILQTVQKNN
jgi:hypothetical protein